MILSDPVTWVPYLPWVYAFYILWDAWIYQPDEPIWLVFSPPATAFVLYILATQWASTVSKVVPEPYLDEIFHIPQAQNYCAGDFHIWDPKLTTPPGLYAFATWFGNLAGIRSCDVPELRYFNSVALVFAMIYAASCYAKISGLTGVSGLRNAGVLHNAFNIALFPPFFFFSGLFYTDVLSTCVVLKMYRDFLNKRARPWLYLTGLLALTMRQTNIFWVAVFLGGLEVVRTLKAIEVTPEEKEPDCWQGVARAAFHRYERGEIHDPSLSDAGLYDFVLCGLSIAIAVIFHPVLILRKLYPYICILLSFGYFVFWNGGVVLGDKSNHIATIHLPQLLYLWPFIAFFSFPLLIPSILRLLVPPRTFPSTSKILQTIATVIVALVMTLAIIHYNTIIHPFTLADNRHYMFYIFRYSILSHPSIRYLLAPIYILSFYLCYSTLTPPSPTSSNASPSTNSIAITLATKPTLAEIQRNRKLHTIRYEEGPSTSWFIIWFAATALSLVTAPLVEPRYFIIPWVVWRLNVPGFRLPTRTTVLPSSSNAFGTSTSTSVANTTGASTAVATSQTSTPSQRKRKSKHTMASSATPSTTAPSNATLSSLPHPPPRRSFSPFPIPTLPRTTKELIANIMYWGYEAHDPRLWIETLWFALVNLGTGYVFLNRGFEWVQEPGKVQRFMW